MYYTLDTFRVTLRDFVRQAWLPTYLPAAALAAALLALNAALDLSEPALLVATGVLAALVYWAVFYFACLRPDERTFFKQLAARPFGRR
jgi:hypothetical protein